MKYWAVFYRKNETGYTEVLGDRGILRLDGRLGRHRQAEAAVNWAWRHGFTGYRIARGDRLGNLFYLTARIIPVLTKGTLVG